MNEGTKELTVEFLMNQLAIEDCNAQHKILSKLNSSSSVNLLHTTIDRTRGRATNQSAPVERMWDRIILECILLQITTTHLENPQEWERKVYEMWKARAPARPEMCSQECKVQGVPQNWTFLQCMSIHEKRQESQSCPDSTSVRTGHSY